MEENGKVLQTIKKEDYKAFAICFHVNNKMNTLFKGELSKVDTLMILI